MRIITEPRDQGERLVARLREMIDHETMVRDAQVRCIVLTDDEYRIYREYLVKMVAFPPEGRFRPNWCDRPTRPPAPPKLSDHTYFDGYRVIREGEVMP